MCVPSQCVGVSVGGLVGWWVGRVVDAWKVYTLHSFFIKLIPLLGQAVAPGWASAQMVFDGRNPAPVTVPFLSIRIKYKIHWERCVYVCLCAGDADMKLVFAPSNMFYGFSCLLSVSGFF